MNSYRISRDYRFDMIRGIAILCVILAHSAMLVENNIVTEWIIGWFSLFLRPLIAVFIFISGFFFKQGMSFKELIKRIIRLWIPYTVFTGICILFVYDFKEFSLNNCIIEFGKYLLCEAVSIYYFVFLLIACTLLAYILDKLFNLEENYITIMLVFLVFSIIQSAYLIDLLKYFRLDILWSDFILYRAATFWFLFFITGYAYNRKKEKINKFLSNNLVLIRGMSGICFAIINILYYFSIGNNDNLMSPALLILCCFAILILLGLRIKNNILLSYIGKCSYTLYLSHALLIILFLGILRYLNISLPVWSLPLVFIVLTSLCLLFCHIAGLLLKEKSRLILGCTKFERII